MLKLSYGAPNVKQLNFLLTSLLAVLLMVGCASTSDDDDTVTKVDDVINYVALGASDATGIGAFPLTDGYVFRIKDALEDRGKKVDLLNLGIPTANIPAIEKAAIAALKVGVEKDLVTIWTGANDLIGGDDVVQFEKSLDHILQHLRQDDSVFIVMMNLPDLTQIKRFREKPDKHVTSEQVTAFNQAITRQAKKYNVPIVDFFSDNPGDELVSDIDGFHPNNDGHKRIANLFLKIILPKFNL